MRTSQDPAPTRTNDHAPGFYRYKVGDISVIVVADGARSFPLPDDFVTNAKKGEVSAALEAAGMPKDMMTIHFSPIVADIGERRVVIDTGFGPAAGTAPGATTGLFHSNLTAAGLAATDIDTVVISHFHGDHVNGLLDSDGKAAFPNAEILVPAPELAFWTDDGEMARAPAGRMKGLFESNRRIFANADVKQRLSTYAWDQEIASGIFAKGTPGHTVGHTSFLISSGSSAVFVQSDVTNNPALFARHPHFHAAFDQDGAQAETTRLKVYEMLVAEKIPVQGFHYPFPALAYVEREGRGYRTIQVAMAQ